METLYGWAIKLEILPFWDHTYATSSDGYKWACWGRDSGGKQIASGSGSSKQANCISQPNSHADIVYGVTGVCHQTANRILYPAGVTVCKANGYGLTFALYGTWGDEKTWNKKKQECMKKLLPQLGGDEYFTAIHENLQKIGVNPMEPREDSNDSDQQFRAEFEALIQTKLGHPIDEKRMNELCKHVGDTHVFRNQLSIQKRNQTISPESFSHDLNKKMNEKLQAIAKILTEEEYFKLFDVKPGVEVTILDPEILKETWDQ